MKKLQIHLILLFGLIFSQFIFAQRETNRWYFGSTAGLDFNAGAPLPLTNSAMNASEGCSVASDRNTGALLFYANGDNVYGRNHAMMPSASTFSVLGGSTSSAQSCVIVPAPCSDTLFYLFTTDANENSYVNGLQYSVIDMSLNGGNGDIVPGTMNTQLIAPACEKLAAVHHANGQDIWVVTVALNTNSFYAYLVTSTGVQPPVISSIGNVYSGSTGPRAYLKFSPNGQKLFSVVGWSTGQAQLFDFNNTTGAVSGLKTLDANQYGASFSNNSQLLYTCNSTQVFQYDITSNNAATILASKQTVGTATGSNPLLRAMQLGIDGKIYIADFAKTALSVINNPNTVGAGCNFSYNTVNLAGRSHMLGLPNFVESYFDPNYTYKPCGFLAATTATLTGCKNPCTGTATATPQGGVGPFAYSWNTSPVQTTQTASSLCAGTYTVTITDSSSMSTVTATVTVNQTPNPVVIAGAPLTLTCITTSGTISASSSANVTFNWSGTGIVSGGTTSSPTVNAAGTYTVIATDTVTGCSDTTTVIVNKDTIPPTINAGPQLTLTCTTLSGNISITTNPANATYNWTGSGITAGATSSSPTVNAPGTYTVIVTNPTNGCTSSSTVTVAQDTATPNAAAGAPLVFTSCINPSGIISVTSNTPNATYNWSGPGIVSGATTANPTVNAIGTYTVTITNPANGCTTTATVSVTSNTPPPDVNSSAIVIPCTQSNDTIVANSLTPGVTYSWTGPGILAGATTSSPTVNASGTYTVIVTDPATGCTNSTTVTVAVTPGPIANVSNDTIIIQGDSASLIASGGVSYNWIPATNLSSSSGTSVFAFPSQTTTYCVEVTDNAGCKDTTCVTVTVELPCPKIETLAIPNAFSPNNDGVNDVFCLQGWEACIEKFNVVIYNRWGEKVFESIDPAFCWDGTYKGVIADAQVFVYHIKAIYIGSADVILRKGNITLIK